MFEGRFRIKETYDEATIIDTKYDDTPYYISNNASTGLYEIVDILNELDEICESLRSQLKRERGF